MYAQKAQGLNGGKFPGTPLMGLNSLWPNCPNTKFRKPSTSGL